MSQFAVKGASGGLPAAKVLQSNSAEEVLTATLLVAVIEMVYVLPKSSPSIVATLLSKEAPSAEVIDNP